MQYNNGERVFIKGGSYKGRYAIYLGRYGRVMCSVKVEGDTATQRNIWLTSITSINNNANDTATEDDEDIRRAGPWKSKSFVTEDIRRKSKSYVIVPNKAYNELVEEMGALKLNYSAVEKDLAAIKLQMVSVESKLLGFKSNL
jgi:hypothetical protein